MEKKRYGLLKIISIVFLVFAVLTWFIPTGSFSNGEFVKGETSPVGLYGLFVSPVYSFAVFAQYFVVIICIGGFYGVLNKTLVYQKIVNYFSNSNKAKFLIATILINGLLASLFNEIMFILVLFPFFATVLLKKNYDRLTVLASTIGASMIGGIASIAGNLAIYKSYFQVSSNTPIVFNLIIFIVLIFIYIMYITSKLKKNANNGKNEEKVSILLYTDKKGNNKSVVPLVIVLVVTLLLLILGLYNWYYAFNMSLFSVIHEKLATIEMFNISIVGNIFGSTTEIGYFSNYDLSAILVLASVIIAWLYSVKLDEVIDSLKKGAKEMLLPAVYVVLASTIFACVVTSSSGNISLTISNFILNLFNDFNVLTGAMTGIAGSLFYNDFLYFINGLYGIVSLYNNSILPTVLFVFQSMFGIMMMILPVSITLVFGLVYLNVSYKDWLKYIWIFVIQALAICLIGSIILGMI